MKLTIGNGCVLKNGLPRGFVITDRNVFEEYGHLIKNECFIINGGEKDKSLEKYCDILENLESVDTIIAFGGGVVGDLAGFVSSTYKRGINLIQIPTSLVAMVDSSIGGKNGVNLGNKKNYVGSFYQPKEVLIDPLFLGSLSRKEFANGVAEIIKYGLVFDKPPLERLEKGIFLSDGDLKEIIAKCVDVKMDVVKEDIRDLGVRHTLNFGHTVGHALELIYNLGHGEAISIGMIAEMKLGKIKKFFDEDEIYRAKEIFKVNNLPYEFPKGFDLDEVLNIMMADKKGEFTFALSKKNFEVKFSEKEVREFLENESNY